MYISNLMELINMAFGKENENKTFDRLSIELVELCKKHFSLIEQIRIVRSESLDPAIIKAMSSFTEILKTNKEKLLQIISFHILRNIRVHKISETDTLWRISKNYNSSISEICELNSIKNIFALEEDTILLVPTLFFNNKHKQ